MANCTVERHDRCYCTVNALCALFLIRFDIACGICPHIDVIHHPSQRGVAAVGDPTFEYQFHEFFRRRTHIFESLTEWNDRETCVRKVLAHLHCAPSVVCDFLDVIFGAKICNELLDESIMNNVSFGCHGRALRLPHIIRYMVAPHSEVNRVLRHPKVRENIIRLVLFARRKHKNKCRYVRTT